MPHYAQEVGLLGPIDPKFTAPGLLVHCIVNLLAVAKTTWSDALKVVSILEGVTWTVVLAYLL
jgi:hypothetical protein